MAMGLGAYKDELCSFLSQKTVREQHYDGKFRAMFSGWLLHVGINDTTGMPQRPLKIAPDMDYLIKRSQFKPGCLDGKKIMDGVQEIHQRMCGLVKSAKAEWYLEYAYMKQHSGLQLNAAQAKMLRSLHTGDKNLFGLHRDIILGFFSFLQMYSNHLAVPPPALQNIRDKYKCVELFGTPLNTITSMYCSPTVIGQRFFGSQGRAQDFLKRDLTEPVMLLCNPPYNSNTIDELADLLVAFLDRHAENNVTMSAMVILPAWDATVQKKIPGTFVNEDPCVGYRTIEESKHHRVSYILDRQRFTFFDYFTKNLRRVGHTTMQILSNTTLGNDALETDFEHVLRDWANWTMRNDKQ
jgi:hypothetical protein